MTASATLVEPAWRSAPPFSRTLGPEVAELAVLADFAPDPEQRLGLDLLFAMDANGRSAAFEFAVICSRQNLKTGLFKQAALGWLFITDQQLIVWSAHEFRTAQEAFRDMESLIGDCEWLSRRVLRVHRANGDESIELRTGQRLIFKARTAAGGRGLTGDKVVLDEAFALQAKHMGALLPTLSVRPDPQVVYGSSAGLATSAVLRGVRDRGRPGGGRLAYLEWGNERGGCVDSRCSHAVGTSGCALDDVDRWAGANPLLGRTRSNGTGLTVEYVRAERAALPPEEFARERLGWWDDPDGAAAVFGDGRWDGCVAERPEGMPVAALSVAVAVDLASATIAAAGVGPDGRVHVRPLECHPGTSWVVDSVAALHAEFRVPVTVDGKGPGAGLLPRLEDAGVTVRVASTSDVLTACADLFQAVQDGRLGHLAYPELDRAVAGAVQRPVGDRWAWGRRTSTADVSPLEAVTLAAWAARNVPVNVWGFFS